MKQIPPKISTSVKKTNLSPQEKRYYLELFDKYLKKTKLRCTTQRSLVLEVVLNSERHIDAETIINIVKQKDSSLGVATVYRTLRMMTSAGLLVERYFDDSARAQFEFVDSAGEHHDHIICQVCKKIVEFYNQELENLQLQIANELKFDLKNHRMELFGVCSECQKLQPN